MGEVNPYLLPGSRSTLAQELGFGVGEIRLGNYLESGMLAVKDKMTLGISHVTDRLKGFQMKCQGLYHPNVEVIGSKEVPQGRAVVVVLQPRVRWVERLGYFN